MGPQRRAQQVHIRGIGQKRVLHDRVLAFGGGHAEPQIVAVVDLFGRHEITWLNLPNLNGSLAQKVPAIFFGQFLGKSLAQLRSVWPVFGGGDLRHLMLPVKPLLLHLKRRRQVEDLLAMLDRHHPPGRKTAPIPGAVDLIDHRDLRIPGPDEIGMKRMARALGHRAICGHQCLRDDMAAKDPHRGLAPRTGAPKQIDLKLFDIQQIKQLPRSIGHESSFQAGSHGPSNRFSPQSSSAKRPAARSAVAIQRL